MRRVSSTAACRPGPQRFRPRFTGRRLHRGHIGGRLATALGLPAPVRPPGEEEGERSCCSCHRFLRRGRWPARPKGVLLRARMIAVVSVASLQNRPPPGADWMSSAFTTADETTPHLERRSAFDAPRILQICDDPVPGWPRPRSHRSIRRAARLCRPLRLVVVWRTGVVGD